MPVAAGRRVQRRGRLVEEEHVRLGEERHRQIEALLVPRGQVTRRTVVRRDLDEAKQAVRRSLRVLDLLEAREELEVLARGQPAVLGRALRHPADLRGRTVVGAHREAAVGGAQSPRENREQGGLARAVRADEGERVAGANVEVRGRERDDAPVPARDALGGQERRWRTVRSGSSYRDHPITQRC